MNALKMGLKLGTFSQKRNVFEEWLNRIPHNLLFQKEESTIIELKIKTLD